MTLSKGTQKFINLVTSKGAPVIYHREDATVPCPCLLDGFRDPTWHKDFANFLSTAEVFSGVGSIISTSSGFTSSDSIDYRMTFEDAAGTFVGGYVEKHFSYSSPPAHFKTHFILDSVSPPRNIVQRGIWRSINGGPFYHLGTYSLGAVTVEDAVYDISGNVRFVQPPLTCNEAGFLGVVTELTIKGFMQPVVGGRRGMQSITEMFGEIQTDDYIGILPPQWGATPLDFGQWSPAGDEFVEFSGMKFVAIAWSRVPDPFDTSAIHHWEVAFRRINNDPIGPSTGY